jgi:hypothetical protein
MRFTRASVQHMVRYLAEGTTPPDWNRARAWRFRQQMGAFTWRVGDASTGSREAGADATDATTSVATAELGPARALEVQVPGPSADGRASPRPAAVWLRVVAEENVDDVLHALYIDPAQGALRGAKALYERVLTQYVGISMRHVSSFLKRQETRQAVLPKQGYLVVQPADVSDVGHWQADLTDVALFTNTDAKHMLVCVDAFSKYAWAVPLESKHAARMPAELEALWLQEGPPSTLRTDGGSDMNNADMAALCARYGVARKVCAPYNQHFNGGVERLGCLVGSHKVIYTGKVHTTPLQSRCSSSHRKLVQCEISIPRGPAIVLRAGRKRQRAARPLPRRGVPPSTHCSAVLASGSVGILATTSTQLATTSTSASRLATYLATRRTTTTTPATCLATTSPSASRLATHRATTSTSARRATTSASASRLATTSTSATRLGTWRGGAMPRTSTASATSSCWCRGIAGQEAAVVGDEVAEQLDALLQGEVYPGGVKRVDDASHHNPAANSSGHISEKYRDRGRIRSQVGKRRNLKDSLRGHLRPLSSKD